MSTVLGLLFFGGVFCIWYFVKRKPDKRKRNIAIATAGVALVGGLLFGNEPEERADTKSIESTQKSSLPKTGSSSSENKNSVEESTIQSSSTSTLSSAAEVQESKASSESAKVDVTLEAPAEVEADPNNQATIAGKTTPNARVSVGLGVIGDSTTADGEGNFSLTHELSKQEEDSITLYATLDGSTESTKVKVRPNSEKVAQQEAEKQREAEEASLPVEYRSALNKAKSYATSMNMSRQRVHDQLTSEYGEQFSPEAAQYAMDNLHGIDWNANALEKAKSYQEMDMSPDRIRDQLTSEHGEQFTPEEADYAMQHLNQ
ncbi:Ltp family lipoprotein [Enterococcus sp. CSURQ0835]|uniref:Ltp family lipoprotein n=1 Tax=Enterococcus sp. CSURQ0835 TaxID=2681394 RepID=UPI00135B9A72